MVLDTGVPSIGNEIQLSLFVNNKTVRPWLKVSVSPVEIDGKRHVIATVEDITSRKETEGMLIIEKNRADKMADESLSANKAKSQFLASMSHEIRTPMNSIIGFSDILAEEVSSDDHKEYVGHIQSSGNHLLQLINDILDYSKIEAGKMEVDISFSSLQDIIDKVDSMMRPFAEAKNLDFVLTKSPDVPDKIRTDPTRVEQCLINLVNNAIKFTDQGHVKVNTSVETIDSKEFVCIDVDDTGIGISPKAQHEIFDSFTQADQGTAKKIAGTGLGLAITKQLTELLGGTVRLASEQGEGSTFSILIPVGCNRKGQRTNNDLQHQNTQKNEKLQISGKCLVAEDDAVNQHLMKILLEKMGLSVTLANSPEEVVEKTENTQFDMIFIDLPSVAAKPGTLEKIRENTHQTPIIALTANPIIQENYTICDKCLQKPITQKILEETAKDYITKKLIANTN
jgi:signal transduction histidine kinase/CheY-like chemotaxis protein